MKLEPLAARRALRAVRPLLAGAGLTVLLAGPTVRARLDGLGLNCPTMASPRRGIGLTGGIGSGKSTVATALAALGAAASSTHRRDRTQPHTAWRRSVPAIVEQFGADPKRATARACDRSRIIGPFRRSGGAAAILHCARSSRARRDGANATQRGTGAAIVFDVPLLVGRVAGASGRPRAGGRLPRRPGRSNADGARSGWTRRRCRPCWRNGTRRGFAASADAVIYNDGSRVRNCSRRGARSLKGWSASV